MFRSIVFRVFWLLPLALFACQGANNEEPTQLKTLKVEGTAFGTVYHITYRDSAGRQLKPAIDSVLQAFDRSLSTYNPQSIISRINRNEDVATDAFIDTVFGRAQYISQITEGAFDCTVAPLVNAWGFGFSRQDSVTPELIRSLLPRVGYRKVRLEEGRIRKESPEVLFDFNALAEGYGVDVVAQYLRAQGIRHLLVEIGGEVRAEGLNPEGKKWRVGIDKPVDNAAPGDQLQAILSLSDCGLATSGNYRKFYIKDGVKYAHIIDPRTGYPVRHSMLSATIVAPDCMTADALATSCMVMGLEKSKALIATLPQVHALLIYTDTTGSMAMWESPGMISLSEDGL